MSTTTFALGLGGGLALWHLTRANTGRPRTAAEPVSPPSPAPRNGAVRIEPTGLMFDGASVGLSEAVVRCKEAGGATVIASPGASATLYAEVMTALATAQVPIIDNAIGAARPRQGRGSGPRTSSDERSSTFTLAIYPKGLRAGRREVRWYTTAIPTTWEDARDRLAAAGVIDASAISPNLAGYWKLTTEPAVFEVSRAIPLPPRSVGSPRDARRGSKRYAREGRRILRDGEPLVVVERVGSDSAGYAVSPYDADRIAERIVRLLNRHGER